MKLFGTLAELVKIVFRKGNKEVNLEPATQSGSGPITFTLPDAGGNSATVAVTSNKLSAFASTTSNELAGVISDETGNATNDGKLVFNSAPTFQGAVTLKNDSIGKPSLRLTEDAGNGTDYIQLQAPDILTTNYTLTLPNTLPSSNSVYTTNSSGTSTWVNYSQSDSINSIVQRDGSGKITTSSPTIRGDLLLQNTTGAQPTLQLSEDPDNGTNKVVVQAPASLAADYTLTLPTDDGNSGQVLSTDGSGVLSWASAATIPALGAVYSDGSALQTTGSTYANDTTSGGLVSTTTQTFGGTKTFSSPIVADSSVSVKQIATPSNPSAGYNKVYTKSDGGIYTLDSSGNEFIVSSGVQYISNSNASTSANDTTSFASGAAGQSIVAVSNANNWVKKRVQLVAGTWASAGTPKIRVSPGNDLWMDASDIFPSRVPAITGWTSYTPTFNNIGNATTTFYWRRVGGVMEIKGTFKFGTTLPNTNFPPQTKFSLPSGFTADYTSHPVGITGTDAYQAVGLADFYRPNGTFRHLGHVIRDSSSNTDFYMQFNNRAVINSENVLTYGASDFGNTIAAGTSPVTTATGDTLQVLISVPISQWNSTPNGFYGLDLQFISANTTQIDVAFGGDGASPTQAWSSFTSWKWRVDVNK